MMAFATPMPVSFKGKACGKDACGVVRSVKRTRCRRRPRTILCRVDDDDDENIGEKRSNGEKDEGGLIGLWKGMMGDKGRGKEEENGDGGDKEKWSWGGKFGRWKDKGGDEDKKGDENKVGWVGDRVMEVIRGVGKKEVVGEGKEKEEGYLDKLSKGTRRRKEEMEKEDGNVVKGLFEKLADMRSKVFQNKSEAGKDRKARMGEVDGDVALKDIPEEIVQGEKIAVGSKPSSGKENLSHSANKDEASSVIVEEKKYVAESTNKKELDTVSSPALLHKSMEPKKNEEQIETVNENNKNGGSNKKETSVARRGRSLRPDIVPIPQKDIAQIRLIFGSETFFATETLSPPGGLIFRGNLRGEPTKTLEKLEHRLHAKLGSKYTLCLAEGDEDLRPVVVVVPTSRDTRPWTPRQKLMSFMIGALTLLTCIGRGAYIAMFANRLKGGPPRINGLFAYYYRYPSAAVGLTIAVVLLFSQLVQRVVASRHRTRIGLPFVIPSYQLGSFGSVVQVASPPPTRAALFDIAISGAATLFLTSLALFAVGLYLSTSLGVVIPMPTTMLSDSLFLTALTRFITRGKMVFNADGIYVGLHPLAIIGANCMTISALTLLPIRQFDGGRIISAIYGRKIALLASRITVFFLLLASSKNPYFIVFLALVLFGPWALDRPAKNELTEPDAGRVIVAYAFLLAMIAILLPWPASIPALGFLGFKQ